MSLYVCMGPRASLLPAFSSLLYCIVAAVFTQLRIADLAPVVFAVGVGDTVCFATHFPQMCCKRGSPQDHRYVGGTSTA